MRVISLLVAIALLMIPLCACGNAGENENSAAVSAEPVSEAESEPESVAESELEPEPIDYDVVYYRFYADEADSLAAKMGELYGKTPAVVKYDQNAAMPEHAIYLGQVTDGVGNELCDSVKSLDYGVKSVDGNIYVYGGSRDSVKTAIAYFAENFLTDKGVAPDGCEYLYEHVYALAGAAVNGNPLGNFTVIFSPTDNEAKYSNVATAIKNDFSENADVSLKTAASTRSETECEILLGCATGRDISKQYKEKDFAYNEYLVEISGGKVAIVGGNACAVWHGWKAFCEYLKQCEDLDAADTTLRGTANIIKVACIGDSITIGINSSDPYVYTYPNYLQEMLGYDYYVRNFGASGYSVVYTDEYAYSKHAFYLQSKQFAADVVIWMLGTNDGNPGQAYKAWEGTDREAKYVKSANDMFAAYEKANPDVQIFVSLPATLFESTVWVQWKEWGDRIVKYVIPLNGALAEDHGYPVIDMYSWSLEHPGVFPDGLHPKDKTYKDYAQRVYDEIIDVIKKPAE